MFQNPQGFVTGGGSKGLQEQVLLAGRYFINPRFATVELVDMAEVPIANVGVVVAFDGKEGNYAVRYGGHPGGCAAGGAHPRRHREKERITNLPPRAIYLIDSAF